MELKRGKLGVKLEGEGIRLTWSAGQPVLLSEDDALWLQTTALPAAIAALRLRAERSPS